MNISSKILILGLIFAFSFGGAEAQTLNELKTELNTVSLAIAGLSTESSERRAQISLISEKLENIADSLAAYRSSSQGRVLGASYSPSSSSSRRPIANVDIDSGTRNSDRVIAGGSYRDVLTFKLKPENSNIEVQFIEVAFDKKPWQYLEEISLVAGNKTLFKIEGVEASDFYEVDDNIYALRFSDLSYEIKDGYDKTFKIRVKAQDFRTSSGLRIFLRENAIRIVDEGNFTQQIPNSGGERGKFSNEFEIDK